MSDFEKWWDREGNDTTSHEGAKRACEIAWENGTYKINEGLLEALSEYGIPMTGDYRADCHEYGKEQVDRELRRRDAIAKARGEA